MRYLAPVLGLGPGSVVSLVGAGGKTSLLFALAREFGEAWGWDRVLVTTTTRLFYPAAEDFPPLRGVAMAGAAGVARVADATIPGLIRVEVAASLAGVLAAAAPGRLDRDELLVLAQAVEPVAGPGPSWASRRKINGLPPEWVDAVAAANPDLVILVEADGSARRPLKAPASHEPVIPSSSTAVVAVAGLDALGRSLDAATAHRPEQVSRLTRIPPGEAITAEGVATVLWHAWGCGRGRPPAATLTPVVNKIDAPALLPAARGVASALQRLGAGRVIFSSCLDWPVVAEVVRRVPPPPVAAVILAAGVSSRLGQPKQLLTWQGRTLVERAVGEALRSSVTCVYVVLGHRAGEVASALAALKEQAGERLTLVYNADYLTKGQSSSVRAGLAALSPDTQAVIFAPVDQPLVGAAHYDALVDRFTAGTTPRVSRPSGSSEAPPGSAATVAPMIVVSRSREGRGLPVLFGRFLFAELAGVEGDEGGRSVIRRHLEAVTELPVRDDVLHDVDTWEDYTRLLEGLPIRRPGTRGKETGRDVDGLSWEPPREGL